jgi:hypothetical protein
VRHLCKRVLSAGPGEIFDFPLDHAGAIVVLELAIVWLVSDALGPGPEASSHLVDTHRVVPRLLVGYLVLDLRTGVATKCLLLLILIV